MSGTCDGNPHWQRHRKGEERQKDVSLAVFTALQAVECLALGKLPGKCRKIASLSAFRTESWLLQRPTSCSTSSMSRGRASETADPISLMSLAWILASALTSSESCAKLVLACSICSGRGYEGRLRGLEVWSTYRPRTRLWPMQSFTFWLLCDS